MDHLFVYGTLRPALAPGSLRSLVAGLEPLGSGWIAGRLHDLGPYPAAVLTEEGNSRVLGEVLRLPEGDKVLAALDEYEGFDPRNRAGSLFVRVRCCVHLAIGGRLECWVYAFHRDVGAAPLVPDGDYAAYRAGRNPG
jgi:gamma-glutamylcyclotransferase (GGCT)/AIG2-like uncharacterized protein YtfP